MEEGRLFSVSRDGERMVVAFHEDCKKIDGKNYSEIEDETMAVVKNMTESEFVFDLKNVTYVSSAGLRAFSAINTHLQEQGVDYCLTNLTQDILKMFQLTGYSSMFKVEGQREF